MNADLEIRAAAQVDHNGILSLYRETFPQEDLVPLVSQLLAADEAAAFVAIESNTIVGHICVTKCSVAEFPSPVALLGPLAVSPDKQKHGIGSKLVNRGFEAMKAKDIARAFVLGDPNYYTRFGFKPDTAVTPPYPLPADWKTAWQSCALRNNQTSRAGKLTVPGPWRKKALWSP